MRCPYCGGYHYGYGEVPAVNYTVPNPLSPVRAQDILKGAMAAIREEARKDPYERDVLPRGDGQLWAPRVYGTDERGENVTVAFGRAGTTKENHAMISDDHITGWTFYGERDNKGHDHIGPGPKPDQQRGRYTGWEAFRDPD